MLVNCNLSLKAVSAARMALLVRMEEMKRRALGETDQKFREYYERERTDAEEALTELGRV